MLMFAANDSNGVLYAVQYKQTNFSFVIDDFSLISLFISAFISSTLLPGGSEVLLIYMATQTDESLLSLWFAASLGNTLGGLTSWLLGYWL